MKTNRPDLETTLRQAPAPPPPSGLRDRLLDAAKHAPVSPPPDPSPVTSPARRWWPALAAAGLALASLGLAAVQHAQIRTLRQTVETLRQQLETLRAAPPETGQTKAPSRTSGERIHVPLPNGRAELERLRTETAQSRAQIQHRETLAAENSRLREELEALGRRTHPEVYAAIDAAEEEAVRAGCINNLKQLGLAARIYATDHADVLPPDIQAMTKAIGSPERLVCPADTSRQAAASWEEFTPANSSYEYLAANGSETEPQRVMFRCRIHGFVTLGDGSVVTLGDGSAQRLSEQARREQLTWRDGKLWYAPPAMDRMMMERYGLLPSSPNGLPPFEDLRNDVVPSEAPWNPPSAQSGNAPQLDRLMMERYGLLPSNGQTDPYTVDSPLPGDEALAPGEAPTPPPGTGMDRLMMERYGLLPPANSGPDQPKPQEEPEENSQ